MEVKINRNELLEKMRTVASIIDKKAIIESLKFVKFKVNGNQLTVIATSTFLNVLTTINDFEIKKSGTEEFLLEPQKTIEFIAKLKGQEYVTIVVNDSTFESTIKSGKSKIKMNGVSPSDFPKIHFDKGENQFILNAGAFMDCIEKVKNSATIKEQRPVFKGVNLKSQIGVIQFNATDSYRMSRTHLFDNKLQNVDFNVTLPNDVIKFICKLITDSEETLNANVSNSMMTIQYKDYFIGARLITDTYPNLDRLIADDFKLILKFKTDNFMQMLDICSILRNESSIVKLEFDFSKNKLVASSNVVGEGSAKDELVDFDILKNENGDKMTINLNIDYLKNAINSLKVNEFFMKINESNKPIIITDNTENNNEVQLLISIKTYDE